MNMKFVSIQYCNNKGNTSFILDESHIYIYTHICTHWKLGLIFVTFVDVGTATQVPPTHSPTHPPTYSSPIWATTCWPCPSERESVKAEGSGRKLAHNANVQGEPVFSVMAAGWFCEKSDWIGKVRMRNRCFWKHNGCQPASILRRRILTWMNCEIGGFHLVWFI